MPLCRMLQNQGATTLTLPVIEIRPLKERRDLAAQLSDLQHFDLIIFSSANAVRFGVSFLDQKRDLMLAAVGPATARALNQAGYRVAIQPQASFDTEGLLAHPRLEHVGGHRVLLIKGRGGRPLLQQELTRRGATVVSADVYERVPVDPAPEMLDDLQERLAAGDVHAITATSLEIAGRLLGIAPPGLRTEFERALWVVPGERVAAGLRELGLQAPLLTADSAEDQDLVAALIRWRSSVSGA
jgi:uroporphyrinogen-III synthase